MMLVLKIPINGILMTLINFYDYRLGTGIQTVITTLNVIKAWIKMFDAPELFKSTIGKFRTSPLFWTSRECRSTSVNKH